VRIHGAGPGDGPQDIDVLVFCPECGVIPAKNLATGAYAEMRFFVSAGELDDLRKDLAKSRCINCGGPMDVKTFAPLRLVGDDE
jgi:hypothetical protein